MSSSLAPAVWSLPEEAAPFVREFLLEVVRRLPTGLGTPPRFAPPDLTDAAGCLDAARRLLCWLDGASASVGQAAGEMEEVFVSLLRVVHEIEGRLHRAVLQTRSWVEEEVAFSHAVRGVLRDLDGPAASRPSPTLTLLKRIVGQIEEREEREHAEALDLSHHFDRVEGDLHGLRNRVADMEERARRLLDRSLRDRLTGLWNQQACRARLSEEISRARRYATPLSLVVWDVDDLRAVNEEHGHTAGDAVLQALAGRVSALLRRSDFLARWGSDEFVTVLPSTPLAQATVVAAKICAAAEDGVGETTARVTVSAGVAGLEPADDAASLLGRAEAELRGPA